MKKSLKLAALPVFVVMFSLLSFNNPDNLAQAATKQIFYSGMEGGDLAIGEPKILLATIDGFRMGTTSIAKIRVQK